ncbi:MAG: hypothetical protein M4579_003351 [Chaenotheca gracillima]|nr:MAG: hypothetical protein M4579_003351 [Chaenotheca gracillima]
MNPDAESGLVRPKSPQPAQRDLSAFEVLITTYPPVLESLLSHLPTSSLLNLHHTSPYLRSFLQSYPTAWNHLSFRLAQPSGLPSTSPQHNDPREGRERQSKPYALDQLLLRLVAPFGTRLKTLDLDNTAVSGLSLMNCVLSPRAASLEHLSVRCCKNVSLKYHILPFLQLQRTMSGVDTSNPKRKAGKSPERIPGLALKSLYTYRSRHHRRRPYFASILKKRDSDPEPTHELVELCHDLGIWTDTAWCPTPHGRCLRRKDYHSGHSLPGPFPSGGKEIWVVFDRLWRSGNRIGPAPEGQNARLEGSTEGCLWEDAEYGHDGEALGAGIEHCQGEGKHVPAHMRASHRTFVDDIKCDGCGDDIPERCEQCSVRMHCMGCRKTFCASCAFERPLPEKMSKDQSSSNVPTTEESTLPGVGASVPTTLAAPGMLNAETISSFSEAWFGTKATQIQPKLSTGDKYWWAPGARRSPNLLLESDNNDDNDSENDGGVNQFLPQSALRTPSFKMRWCCLEPMFSGGGGIAFIGVDMNSPPADRIRTAPLPKKQVCEEPRFFDANEMMGKKTVLETSLEDLNRPVNTKYPDPMQYLNGACAEPFAMTAPRILCQDCYALDDWRVRCKACHRALCKDHDLRGLKMRICGYGDLATERRNLQSGNAQNNEHAAAETLGLASQTALPESDDADLAEFAGSDRTILSDLPPMLPPDEGFRLLEGLQISAKKPTPLWKGCGAYFCAWPWPQGDLRIKCLAQLRRCTICGVNQCEECAVSFPPCDCSSCKAKFSCPNCYAAHLAVDCKKAIEEEERKLREKQEAIEYTIQLEQTKRADEMAEKLGEFLVGLVSLEDDDEDGFDDFTPNMNVPRS